MPENALTAWQTAAFARAAAWLAVPGWRWRMVAVCVFSALVFQFPNYRHLYRQEALHQELDPNLEVLKQQIADPFTSHNNWEFTHMSKMAYRLALPLLARALHVGVPGLLGLQLVLGVGMYYALLALLERLAADRLTAALLALGLSLTYFGSAFCFDTYGYFDAVCYALLVFMAATRRPVVLFAWCLLGSFVDERMLPASLLIIFWHSLDALGWARARSWRFVATPQALAIYGAWLAWLLLRLVAMRYTHLPVHRGLVGPDALQLSLRLELVGLGFVSGLKSFWLLPLLSVGLLWHTGQRRALALLAGCALPVFVGAFLVMDTTRSLSYGMPVIFSCLGLLGPSLGLAARRRLALALVFFAWLIPSYNILGHIQYASPVYLALAKVWATRPPL